MVRVIFTLLLLLAFTTPSSYGMGLSLGQSQGQETGIGSEKAVGVEVQREKRKSKGKKEESRSEERESQEIREAARKALARRQDSSLRVSISLPDLFYPIVAQFEGEGVSPFADCRLVSKPVRLLDLGVSFEVAPGIIDLIVKEYYENQAKMGGAVDLDRKEVNRVVYCALEYAAILGSAALKIQESVHEIGADWLGLADLQKFARKFILESIRSPNIEIRSVVETARQAYTPVRCRFLNSLDSFLCGGLVVSLRPLLSIRLGELELYGAKFAGIGGEWNVSAGWSLDKAFEKLTATAKSSSKLTSIANYVDRLESEGQVAKAASIKKRVLKAASTGKLDLILSPTP